MRISALSAATVAKATRLDADYFTAPGIVAVDRIETLTRSGVDTFTIAEVGEVEHVTRFSGSWLPAKSPACPSCEPSTSSSTFLSLPTFSQKGERLISRLS